MLDGDCLTMLIKYKTMSAAPVNHYDACHDFGLLFMSLNLFIDLL